MNWNRLYAFTAASVVALTACSGNIQGVVRQDARRLPIHFSDSRIGTADMQATMPEGEYFEGRTARGTAGTAPKSGASISSDRFDAIETFDGNADAVLTGDRGNIMKCRFHLTDIIFGFSGGGFGICQVSDGRVIDIFF